jgi:hypothetical protein
LEWGWGSGEHKLALSVGLVGIQRDERVLRRERRWATSGVRRSGLQPRGPDAVGDGGSSWVLGFGAGSVRGFSRTVAGGFG